MAGKDAQSNPITSQDTGSTPFTVMAKSVDVTKKPDLDSVRTTVLREGKKRCKVAKHTRIRDRHTGQIHHETLSIQTLRLDTNNPFKGDLKHSIMLSSEDGKDEIQQLVDFVNVCRSGALPTTTGKHIVAPAPQKKDDEQTLIDLLGRLQDSGGYNIIADVLKQATQDKRLFDLLLERAAKAPQLFAEAAAALNLVTYKNAIGNLKSLIERDGVREAQFQELLAENPWLFGSEYSALLDRRRWTRDEQQDFVVRRTADNYIELIEIKTPLAGNPLFQHDRSHDSYYPGAELSKVVGQVQKYVERLDADRNAILANDGEDTSKIRAKVIIGRDGDRLQQQALRRFNGHLHRIEVLTFDQLLRIAQNVLNYLEGALRPHNIDNGVGPKENNE
jgi:hypothetical protein